MVLVSISRGPRLPPASPLRPQAWSRMWWSSSRRPWWWAAKCACRCVTGAWCSACAGQANKHHAVVGVCWMAAPAQLANTRPAACCFPAQFLSNLMHRPFKQQAVKGGDKVCPAANGAWLHFCHHFCSRTALHPVVALHPAAGLRTHPPTCPAFQIDLGGGHELEFVMAPNLHWPDTMFSYDHGTGVMYTCDGKAQPRACAVVGLAGLHAKSDARRPVCTLYPSSSTLPGLLQPLACTTAPRTRTTASWRRWSRTTASIMTA